MSQVDTILSLYKTLAHFPSIESARVLTSFGAKSGPTLLSTWSQRNLERGKSTKFQQMHFVDLEKFSSQCALPVDTSTELLTSVSPSERLRAVIREDAGNSSGGAASPGASKAGGNGSKRQFLEVWRGACLWRSLDLTALDVHGDVCTDGEFGCLEWAPAEDQLLYVAEQRSPKAVPFYPPRPAGARGDGDGDSASLRGTEHEFRPEWGEQLVGRSQPVPVVCDVEAGSVKLATGLPADLSPGQLLWAPGGQGLLGVAWETEPRRLGLVFCTNRPSCIFLLGSDGQFRRLSEPGLAVRSPRFSPDGRRVVWLQRPAGGPHHGAMQLAGCDWGSTGPEPARVILDLTRQKQADADGRPFYGLFCQSLPRRCWATDNRHVFLSSPQRSAVCAFCIDTESGSVRQLLGPVEEEEQPAASLSVLDVNGGVVVAARSALNQPSQLLLLPDLATWLRAAEAPAAPTWLLVTQPSAADLQKLVVRCWDLQADSESVPACDSFTALYMGPAEGPAGSVPLVVSPHGGPHAASANSFSLSPALLALLGYGVLLVNYRGSVGAGQDCVDYLLGRIGDSDACDVWQACQEALRRLPCLDPARVALLGGSHGGFLVTHLSAQHSDAFRAVVAINPVTDVAAMFGVTDIPDWTCVEAGEPYSPKQPATPELLGKMLRCSPVSRVGSVRAPTLLLLGRRDLRVPPSQGTAYYHLLRAHGVTTRLLMYDDNHSLSQVPVELDHVINTVLWFREHL